MKLRLSTVAETLSGSAILDISNRIKKRVGAGEPIYNFTVGDFDPAIFPIPPELEEGIIKAIRERFTNYPAAEGNLDLREAIARFTLSRQGLNFSPEEVLTGSGGRSLIYSLYRVLVDVGDRVLFPTPSWNNHYYTELVQGKSIAIPTEERNGFMPTAESLRPHLSEAVLLALCSPQNPSGTGFTAAALKAICEEVVIENNRRGPEEKKLILLFDQIYHLIGPDSHSHVDPVSLCPEVRPYTIYVDGISKCFAATGLRVGWCLGPAFILSKMKALLTHMGAWAPMAEQKALARFLDDNSAIDRFLNRFNREISMRLELIRAGLLELKEKGYPIDVLDPVEGEAQGAIYLSVKIALPGYTPEVSLNFLLDQAGIGLLPFSVFGVTDSSPWFRLSVGTCSISDIAPMLLKLEQAMATQMKIPN